jgi:lipopolysaccharide transport system ATP-binding protein
MSSDVAIRAIGLSKCYHIYDRPNDRLKQAVFARARKLLGLRPRHYHRDFWALKDVSFELAAGETLGIIGKNGSGKSTLLQIVCDTLSPSTGELQTRGRVAALLELGSGFNPEFTGRENVYLNAALLGLSRARIDDRFERIAAFAEIGEFIEQPVKTYSSGMMLRLAFAVVAHVDADILVIDEALAVGDAFFRQKCMRFLRSFMERGTILFVSHDTDAVLNLCSRAIWLRQGALAASGDPKDIVEMYLAELYEARQGPSPARPAARRLRATRDATPPRDMRLEFINRSNLRNDIELFRFSPDEASFGRGGATVTDVGLSDRDGHPLSWVVGGEPIRLEIRCIAHQHLFGPIIGFEIKDRLGQAIFADNTFLSYRDRPLIVETGEAIEARFDFVMPLLRAGDYTVSAAIAEGTQAEHVQHHWIHDAFAFRVHASSVCLGLVGLAMTDIVLTKA